LRPDDISKIKQQPRSATPALFSPPYCPRQRQPTSPGPGTPTLRRPGPPPPVLVNPSDWPPVERGSLRSVPRKTHLPRRPPPPLARGYPTSHPPLAAAALARVSTTYPQRRRHILGSQRGDRVPPKDCAVRRPSTSWRPHVESGEMGCEAKDVAGGMIACCEIEIPFFAIITLM
jgi:hypothetical protein